MSTGAKRHLRVDFKVLELVPKIGEPVDLLTSYYSVEIFEDLTGLGVVGKIIVNDSAGILEFGPLLGGELLRMQWRTDSNFEYVTKEFRIYDVKRGIQPKESRIKETVLEISFESEFMYRNFGKQYSRSWKDEYTHTIAASILTNMIGAKFERAEVAENLITYTMPYCQPYTAISYLASISRSVPEEDIGYVFYENLTGHYFVTLSSLLKQEPAQDITWIKKLEDKQFIGNAISPQYYDRYANLHRPFMERTWGHTAYYFDYEKKYWERLETDIMDYKEETWNVGQYLHWNKDEMGDQKQFTFHEMRRHKDFKESTLKNPLRWGLLNDYHLIVSISGHSELRIGDVIKVDVPSADHLGDITNKKLKGNWLLVRTKHKIVAGDYVLNMHLVKDSYFDMPTEPVDQHQLVHKINKKVNP